MLKKRSSLCRVRVSVSGVRAEAHALIVVILVYVFCAKQALDDLLTPLRLQQE